MFSGTKEIDPQFEHSSTTTSGVHANSLRNMVCLLSYLPSSLREIVEPYVPLYEEHAPLIGVALASLVAVYVGYLYFKCQREAAVAFNVPVPSEVRNSNKGKKWEEATGLQKEVLEGQVRGVSSRGDSGLQQPN